MNLKKKTYFLKFLKFLQFFFQFILDVLFYFMFSLDGFQKSLWLILKFTKVTTEYQQLPNMDKLDGVAPLMADPPPTSSTTLSNFFT